MEDDQGTGELVREPVVLRRILRERHLPSLKALLDQGLDQGTVGLDVDLFVQGEVEVGVGRRDEVDQVDQEEEGDGREGTDPLPRQVPLAQVPGAQESVPGFGESRRPAWLTPPPPGRARPKRPQPRFGPAPRAPARFQSTT